MFFIKKQTKKTWRIVQIEEGTVIVGTMIETQEMRGENIKEMIGEIGMMIERRIEGM